MDRENESVYLLDMTVCEPRDAISGDLEKGKWTAVDYTIGQGEGKMLFCGPDTQAPPLRMSPGVKGWHHIFVGTYRPQVPPETCLLLKLSGDPGYTRSAPQHFRLDKDLVSREMLAGPMDLCEAYWKAADLTGQEIVFHRPAAGGMAQTVTNISYIRLVPLSRAEQGRAERDLARTDTRVLIANYDAAQHSMWAYATHQEMVDEFQALASSDFKMMLWGCAGAFTTFYPSRVGSEMEWSFGMPPYKEVWMGWQTVDRYRRHGFDPLRAAVGCAHDIGIEIYPQVRMIGQQMPWTPFSDHLCYVGPEGFQARHPEWQCLSREGYRTHHLSQAFPEVRARYVDLFREWVEDYGADGVNIVFCRAWPYVLYEEPVTRSFREKYGADMKELDPFDERVLSHRSGFLTELLRETRRMLDEVGKRQGRRLGTCYVVSADAHHAAKGCPDLGPFTATRSHAMDVETWVKEGLVDHLVIHVEGVGRPDASDRAPLFRPYVHLAEGTATRVYADLYPRRQSADSARVRALACYEAGVDGLCFWDSHLRIIRLSEWAMHRLLGHREELPGMQAFAEGLFRVVPMASLNGKRKSTS
ncbi:MAG: hypothetical protein EXS64_20990 [Candidatus Latescibacteria bacterium]|nr:hypothetical protein [Candidatus Latescibacterota bacterium]